MEKDQASVIANINMTLDLYRPVIDNMTSMLKSLDSRQIKDMLSINMAPPTIHNVVKLVADVLNNKPLPKTADWQAIIKVVGIDNKKFLTRLIELDWSKVTVATVKHVSTALYADDMNQDIVANKSVVCGVLCRWLNDGVKYHRVLMEIKEMKQEAGLE